MSKSNLNEIHTLSAWVRTITGQSGLTTQFVKTPSPYTSGSTIFIPAFTSNMSDEDISKIRWYVLHECLHHTEGPDIFRIADENKLTQDSPLASVFNVIEDARIERAGAKKYRGDKDIISTGRDYFLTKYPDMYAKAEAGGVSADKNWCTLSAVMSASHQADMDWDWASAKHARDIVRALPQGAKDVLKNINDTIPDIADRIALLKDEHEAWELSKLLFDASGNDSKKELERCAEKSKAEKKQGKGDPSKAKGDGTGDAEGESSEGKKGEVTKAKFQDLLPHDHMSGNRETPLELDYSSYSGSKNWAPIDPSKIQVVNFSKGESMQDHYGRQFRTVLRSIGEAGSEASVQGLAARVKRLLTIKAQCYYVGGHKQGRIHNKNLWKVGMPLVGSGDWNSKVFKRKHVDDTLNSAVTICIDFSGSMSGTKLGHAGVAALMLNECMSRSLRVPVEIVTYTSHNGHYPLIGIIKAHDERIGYDTLVDRFDVMSGRMAENPDADAILWAWHRLRGRNEKRKVMIVLSDGQPTAAWQPGEVGRADPTHALREAVNYIQEERNTSVYGIGIQHMGVKDIFKNYVLLQNSSQLDTCILNLIDKEFIK